MASVALAAVSALGTANAETVQTTTVVTQTELPNMEKTDFMAFDLNNDGILSMKEVGEKLFFIFDKDGNQVIDNIEFDQKRVMTIIPMEKQVFTFVDENDDGTPNEATFTYETFIEQSGLIRFDQNMNGLSAAEFIQDSFLQLDDNNSKVVELDEWKRAYTDMARKETERFN
jgi:hypothetical protein